MFVLQENIHLCYNATFLEEIIDIFKPVIIYKKINISEIIIKVFLRERCHFIVNLRQSPHMQIRLFLLCVIVFDKGLLHFGFCK